MNEKQDSDDFVFALVFFLLQWIFWFRIGEFYYYKYWAIDA